MKKDKIEIGLMGLGIIGGQVARILLDSKRNKIISDYVGCPLALKKIKVIEPDLKRPIVKEIDPGIITTDENIFFNSDIDIVIEAIGGENPAFTYLERALKNKKHVVTSNKEVIAKHGIELWTLARQNNVSIRYEASAGGGIPIITPLQRDLVSNHINSIFAIINGTTNYILTRMEKEGIDFSVALKKAQELGYAEADPRNDIEGIDATYKLAIMASLAFHCQIKPEEIYHEGITRLTNRDFKYARELGYAVKLLAIGKQEDNAIQVRVHPVFIPEEALLADVEGVFNAIQIEGDLVGRLLFYGQGAGAFPTSSAVMADVASAARDVLYGIGSGNGWKLEPGKKVKPITELTTRYYLRMEVADSPGVLAQISKILGDNKISILSVIQKETDEINMTAEIVIMTHPAREKAMQTALAELQNLPVVKQISNFIRVEDIK